MNKLKQATQKLGALMLALLMFLAAAPLTQAHANTEPPISVLIDGQPVNFTDQQPTIIDGRTLVSVRVFESLGFNVSWNPNLRQVTVARTNDTIVITIDSETFTTNGVSHTLDVPAQIIGGSTMLPLRAVLESVGYSLEFDAQAKAVLISTSTGGTVEINTKFETPTLDRKYKTAEDFYNIVERHADGTLTVKTDAGNLVRIFISNEPVIKDGQYIGIGTDIDNKRNGFEGVNSFAIELATTTFKGQYVTDESKLPAGVTYWNHTQQDNLEGIIGGIVSVDRPDGSHLGNFMLSDHGKQVYILDATLGEYKVTLLEAPYDFKITDLGNTLSSGKSVDENGNYYGHARVVDNGQVYGIGFSVVSELPSDY